MVLSVSLRRKPLSITPEKIASFYQDNIFLSFYTPKFRLNEIKRIFGDKRTSAGDKIQLLKYLDAHKGDVPAKGPESGELVIKYVGFDGASDKDTP